MTPSGSGPPERSIVRLRIALDDADPPVWRTVELDAETGLGALHNVIQAAMGWHDSHLHEFLLGQRRLGGGVTLAGLAAKGAKRIAYVYDMGDSWEHTLLIQEVLAADPTRAYPRLVDGGGRCPPEDCGGIPGFYNLLDALADPDHPDHEEMLAWHGGKFDAEDMDRAAIEKRLAKIAGRGNGKAKKKEAKKMGPE